MLRTLTWTDPRLRMGVLVLVALAILPVAWYLGSPLFLNQTVNEALPPAPVAQVGEAATGATALRSGQFNAIDGLHHGEGTATVYRQPDGTFVLRLDPFKVTNGPDLYVYLSAQPAPTDATQLRQRGAIEVARLKGNVGSQNYELPANVDISQFRSVVIYCKQFNVVFSTAALVAATS
jgi:hypothetical protein